MKKVIVYSILLTSSIFSFGQKGDNKNISDSIRNKIGSYLTAVVNKEIKSLNVKIDSIKQKGKTIQLFTSTNLSYIAFRNDQVKEIYWGVENILPPEYKNNKIEIITDTQKIEDLVPFSREKKELFANKLSTPLVTNLSKPYIAENGLQNHHLAMWQSHGWYYEQKLSRWEWQRARIFQTVEDLYTQSYVLPYLVPMLENAGANVLLPRERDYQRHEVIVDNNESTGESIFRQKNGKQGWLENTRIGFAHTKEYYLDGENPFKMGSHYQIETVADKDKESICEWIPDIPEKGEYAVYIAYQTFKNSTDNAQYSIDHLGGKTKFKVNQKMGGGTWVFLGFFTFDKGLNENCKITLTNTSKKGGQILTADAVKIGGGMGNIARLPHASGIVTDNTKSSEAASENNTTQLPKIEYTPEISSYPRYTEGARYWLQWAGMPDSIYSRSEGKNDYTDDYQSRGHWVNHISGGSSVDPKKNGLGIPIDLAMAFHTDAGTTMDDTTIGNLGICMTLNNNQLFANGKSKWTSRDLTDLIMDEVTTDIRINYEPNWTRRYIWNKSYSEASTPNVPTMLLELLSHQNFADMKYGLDPRFRFTVSRSIYKGMLKFVAQQYKYDYVVQPLPVQSFSAQFGDQEHVSLRWQAVEDPSEPTAKAEEYIVYTRIDDKAFDNGIVTKHNQISLPIYKDKIYSFKVSAVNKGGESFASEIVSVCKKSNEKGQVLIVNGFDRIAAPFSFSTKDSIGGFVDIIDHGVPDKVQYNYIGSQYEFRRAIPWMDDDAAGFGASNGNYETMAIKGNTFDFPALHGKSIAAAGYSFVSTSRDAVVDGTIEMKNYKLIDLILGKQKQTKIGRGAFPAEFKTFPKALQDKISDYCQQGGNIFISGAYLASDLWDTDNKQAEDIDFATNVLKYKWRVGRAAVDGKVKSVQSPFQSLSGKYEYYSKLNSESYAAESPDAIEPVGANSHTIFRYSENNLSAGVAYEGKYKTLILGFPFETIKSEEERNKLMKGVLSFMD